MYEYPVKCHEICQLIGERAKQARHLQGDRDTDTGGPRRRHRGIETQAQGDRDADIGGSRHRHRGIETQTQGDRDTD